MPKVAVGDRTLRMQPLWARVDANRTKIATFVVLFVVGSALLLALALVAVPGTLIGLVVSGGESSYWSAYALYVGGAMLLFLVLGSIIAAVQLSNAEDWVRNRFSGRALAGGEAPHLESALADMALAAGIPTPGVLVLPDEGHNAFALGTMRKRAVIGVTQGMLDDFTADELRAVAATLIARVIAGDIMFGTALAALMGPIKAIRESRKGAGAAAGGCMDAGTSPGCGDGCVSADGCLDIGSSDDAGGCLGAIGIALFVAFVIAVTYVALLVATWVVTLWGRALQRTSYEKADAEGMLLLKDPLPMISALRKAIRSSTTVSDGDQSYDGIFYASTSGTPRVERAERRRFERLCEVLGVDGLAASLEESEQGTSPADAR